MSSHRLIGRAFVPRKRLFQRRKLCNRHPLGLGAFEHLLAAVSG